MLSTIIFVKTRKNGGGIYNYPERVKGFDREYALALLQRIEAEYSDCVSNRVVDECIDELRNLLGSEIREVIGEE